MMAIAGAMLAMATGCVTQGDSPRLNQGLADTWPIRAW
jgi:hypothetical protein